MLTEREKFIALVDNDSLRKSDAIILLEGDGLNRYKHAAKLYSEGFSDKIVFSGGITNLSYGSFPFEMVKPLLLQEGIPKKALVHESKSLHTQQQAVEVMKLCADNSWESIILIGSHYHQYRAYLTFLKAMINVKMKVLIYNSPARELPWFASNEWGCRIDILRDEFEKIEKYSQLELLATFDEVISYQKWKESQL